jgi:basic membrane protein A
MGVYMKVFIRFTFLLIVSLFLVSCDASSEIVSIEVLHNEAQVIIIDDFDLSDLTLRITYEDGKFMEVPLDDSMLSSNDLIKLSSIGQHVITVQYEGFETTFTILLDDDTLTKQLRSFYTLSQTANAFEGTYEEWLASIQGPTGKDGREVVFQASQGYIQWQYQGDENWSNLIEVSSLIGPKGEDGYSAYDIYTAYYPEYTKSESEWLSDLINGNLTTKEEHIVSFDRNDGTEKTIESMTVINMAYLDLPVPTREGYRFIGWYTGIGPNDIQFSNFFPVIRDMHLIAKWEIETYTITFDLDGGEFNDYFSGTISLDSNTKLIGTILDSESMQIVIEYTILSNKYTLIEFEYFNQSINITTDKYASKFDGWYSIDNIFGDEIIEFGGGSFGNLTLIAKWIAIEIFELAMITDAGDIDDKSFNQSIWEGIVEFAEENNLTYNYYKPTGVSDDAYVAAIDLAVEAGAKIVIAPGFLFEPAIYTSQTKYPEVFFVLIDGVPHPGDYSTFTVADNTRSILFKEQESGFLAGYASVMEGFRELGFMGGIPVPAVVRFGIGYVAGAYYAAKELGLTTFEFAANRYAYAGGFDPTPDVKATAASWYTAGTEVIHVVAGGAGNSVMAAAEELTGKWVIGVDIDQSSQSDTVITSAIKDLVVVVQQALQDYLDGEFAGGQVLTLGVTENAVALPFATSRFETFTLLQYNAILEDIINGTVEVPSSLEELVIFLVSLAYQFPNGLNEKILY